LFGSLVICQTGRNRSNWVTYYQTILWYPPLSLRALISVHYSSASINDIKQHLSSDFRLYADDLKFYRVIENQSDQLKLQDDLDNLVKYCDANHLSLNTKKCTTMSFTKKSSIKNFYYNVRGSVLEKVDKMRDLGVIFDSKLTFNHHVCHLFSSCVRLLGFILRTTADFHDAGSTISLFNSLIRSRLEYCSVIWSPHQLNQTLKLEKLQKKMVKSLYYRNLIPNAPSEFNYEACCEIFRINSLQERRVFSDLKLVIKTFSNEIDTESYIDNFNIHVPQRSFRNTTTFSLSSSKTNLGKFSIFNRICDNFNKFMPDFDPFNCTSNTKNYTELFKIFVKRYRQKS
jgi:hypothetical protein